MHTPFDAPFSFANKTGRRKTVISLTPLIDVVFILLVFFMLASSFMQWKTLSLDTGAAAVPTVSDDQNKPFIIEVREHSLSLNGQTLALDAVISKAQSRESMHQSVSLRAMADTNVQRMIDVMGALDEAGIQPLNLLDDPSWQASASGDQN